jgi:hypothetical protein
VDPVDAVDAMSGSSGCGLYESCEQDRVTPDNFKAGTGIWLRFPLAAIPIRLRNSKYFYELRAINFVPVTSTIGVQSQ